MKKILWFLPLILATGLNAGEKKTGVLFTVTNPSSFPRTMETVSIDLNGFYLLHPEWKNEALTIYTAKTEHVSQSIDNDRDGVDDELIFQASFKPNETKQFELYRKPVSPIASQQKVDVRYVLPREDLAWENDRIAFRIYGNVIAGNVDNGIDVWTKRVRYPIVAKWYKESEGSLPGKDTYHQDRGEGADFFSVGKSLGAGSAGLLWNGALYQGGLYSHHRVITNGPIRTSFEVYYTGWKIDTTKFLERKKISIDAGEQLNEIEEEFTSNSAVETLTIAAGLVKRNFASANRSPDNRWLSLWGLTTPDSVNGYLGTAVVFPHSVSVEAKEDSIQYLLSTTFPKKNKFIYYSGAAWSRMGDIRTAQEWETYLSEFAARKKNPLLVSFQSKKK